MNTGAYSKTFVSVLISLAGAIPVITSAHSWQQVAAYVIPTVLAALGVYTIPNTPAKAAAPPVAAPEKPPAS